MGCHTWFYKKIEVKEEEIVPVVIKSYEDDKKFWNHYLYNKSSMHDYIKDLESVYPEINDEYAKHQLELIDRKIRMINKGLCKEAVNHKYCSALDLNGGVTIYRKGKGFFSSKGTTHDVFRKYGYPLDVLESYEETIAYIEDPKNDIHFYTTIEETKELLKAFWDKYPDGMIDFG